MVAVVINVISRCDSCHRAPRANELVLQETRCMQTPKKRILVQQSSAVYGIGLIGALVYYLQHAHGFGDGVLGVLKAFVWPAILVYKSLDFFKA